MKFKYFVCHKEDRYKSQFWHSFNTLFEAEAYAKIETEKDNSLRLILQENEAKEIRGFAEVVWQANVKYNIRYSPLESENNE